MFNQIKKALRNWGDRSYFGSIVFQEIRRIVARTLLVLPDNVYAKWFYKQYTGKNLNLKNPKTFDEKIWWLKLNNRDPLLTICSDKYAVREIIKKAGFEDILIDQIGPFKRAEDIPFKNFKVESIIKCTSGSGENVFYDPTNPPDVKMLIKRLNFSLRQNPYWFSREWNYKNVPRQFVVERVMRDSLGRLPIDYKFMCFEGEPRLLFLDIGVIDEKSIYNHNYPRNIYDMDFNLMPFIETRENYKGKVEKPENWERMVEVARKLSKPFPFCRVDLYNIDGNIYFGEITFYHGGGCNHISPLEWDYKLGSWIDLKSSKIKH